MIDFEVKMQNILKQFDPKAQDIIGVRAINKIATQAKTRVDRTIRDDYTVKKKDLKIKLYRAKRGMPVAVLAAMRKHLSFTKFKSRQMKPGTRVEMRKGKPIMYKHAFKATMRSGHQGVFTRQIKNGKRVGRLKIKELKGPSPGQLLKRDETKHAIRMLLNSKFARILQHEIKYYFSKLSGGGK